MFWAAIVIFLLAAVALVIWRKELAEIQAMMLGARMHAGCAVTEAIILLILAAIFFGLALVLTLISGHLRGSGSVVDRLKVDSLDPNALKPVLPPTTAPPPPTSPKPSQPPARRPRRRKRNSSASSRSTSLRRSKPASSCSIASSSSPPASS